MRTVAARIQPVVALALLVAALPACAACAPSSAPVPSTTARRSVTPLPAARMISVSARAGASSGASGLVSGTASCPGGETLLSGGYALSGAASIPRAAVVDDYPASASAWAVTVNTATAGEPLTLTVYADCLQANFPVTTRVVTDTQTVPNDQSLHTAVARCPSGTTVTGGGYRDAGFNASPAGNGWQATYIPRSENPPATVRVFALCASHNLQPGVIATGVTAVASGGTASVSAACPAGRLLVGGGYTYTGLPTYAFADQPGGAFASWQAQIADQGTAGGAGGASALTVSAVCVRVASPVTGASSSHRSGVIATGGAGWNGGLTRARGSGNQYRIR